MRTPTSNSDGTIAPECVRFRPSALGRYCRVVRKLDLKRRRGRAPASALAAARTASRNASARRGRRLASDPVGQALGSALGGFLFEHEHVAAVGYATAAFFGAALAALAPTRRPAGKLRGMYRTARRQREP
jgi:hypothetical protein